MRCSCQCGQPNRQTSVRCTSTSLSLTNYWVPNLLKYEQKIGRQRQERLQTNAADSIPGTDVMYLILSSTGGEHRNSCSGRAADLCKDGSLPHCTKCPHPCKARGELVDLPPLHILPSHAPQEQSGNQVWLDNPVIGYRTSQWSHQGTWAFPFLPKRLKVLFSCFHCEHQFRS